MRILTNPTEGLFELSIPASTDCRGSFAKPFSDQMFQDLSISAEFKEVFFTVSHKNVIRGMHFQKSPHDHGKLIFVTVGAVLDVVLDIRPSSPTFGQNFVFNLDAGSAKCIYISPGFAHGFLSLVDNSQMTYLVTTVHAPKFDTGFRWDSFGFRWPITNPILSDRDRSLQSFIKYKADL